MSHLQLSSYQKNNKLTIMIRSKLWVTESPSVRTWKKLHGSKRHSSNVIRNSYKANLNPISTIWNTKVPTSFKYFLFMAGSALTVTNLSHEILITLGPPTGIMSFYANKKWRSHEFKRESAKIVPSTIEDFLSKENKVRIKKYDESALENLDVGIENEYDNFRIQLVELTIRRILDFLSVGERDHSLYKSMIDENQQFSIKLKRDDLETFTVLYLTLSNLQDEGDIADKNRMFIKFSLPFYSSSNIDTTKKKGTVEVYLLEVENSEDFIEYNIKIMITPYKWLIRPIDKLVIDKISGKDIYLSGMLQNSNRNARQHDDRDNEEDITFE